MSYRVSLLLLPFIVAIIAGCSFVDVKPGAEHIILANDVDSCKKLGSTTVSVMHEIVWIDRSEATVAQELQTLAQNSAAKMGGNAIWPESDVKQGEQTFSVFRCEKR